MHTPKAIYREKFQTEAGCTAGNAAPIRPAQGEGAAKEETVQSTRLTRGTGSRRRIPGEGFKLRNGWDAMMTQWWG